VRLVEVPQESGVVAGGQLAHPPLAEVGLEAVLERAADPMDLVEEERHAADAI
jgi:hypothetical protein